MLNLRIETTRSNVQRTGKVYKAIQNILVVEKCCSRARDTLGVDGICCMSGITAFEYPITFTFFVDLVPVS